MSSLNDMSDQISTTTTEGTAQAWLPQHQSLNQEPSRHLLNRVCKSTLQQMGKNLLN